MFYEVILSVKLLTESEKVMKKCNTFFLWIILVSYLKFEIRNLIPYSSANSLYILRNYQSFWDSEFLFQNSGAYAVFHTFAHVRMMYEVLSTNIV